MSLLYLGLCLNSRNWFEDEGQGVNAGILHCPFLSYYRKGVAPRLATGNRDFEIRGRREQRKLCLKNEFALFQSLSPLFLPTYFIKYRRALLKLNYLVLAYQDNFILACFLLHKT